jgi:pectate lyase
MKFTTLILSLLFGALSLQAQSVNINQASGWLESAWVEWQPISGASGYNVYYSGEGIQNQKIDAPLVRSYGSYLRADIPGLKAGTYTIKIAPVINGSEGTATTSSSLTVLPHDRTGFAFANGRTPGAYNPDGTAKSGAVILYITQNTKNTISMDVIEANVNPCIGLQSILDGFKKGSDSRPLIIRMIGQITDLDYMVSGDLVIENSNNAAGSITLEGIGNDAVADGWGIRLKNASNIEIRNIASMNVNSSEGDNIGLQQNNDYIWVHNVDFFYGDAGSDADQAKGDGALDCKKSTYVTFSYNHFWDSGKSNLLGLSEGTTDGLYITYHHNWYDHSDSRHPRVRYYSAHVYNNYYDGIAKYGIGSTLGSSVFAEANYFRNAKYPMLTSMQGSDVYDESAQANDYSDMPTFSKEDGGTIKAYNNYIEGARRFIAYGQAGAPNSTVDYDAYVAQSRNETIGSSIKSAFGSNTYNNFDTNPSIMYAYSPDSPQNAKAKVMQYAGRISGGDFKWTFNNATDDSDYAVNPGLKAAVVNYQTDLVAIQGEGDIGQIILPSSSSINNPSSSSSTPSSSSNSTSSSSIMVSSSSAGTINADIIHNFTTSGITSSEFNITGNLSTTKGTVNYEGLTLTQCLKMESLTGISFNLIAPAVITLVFNSDFNGRVTLDGVNHTVSGGILTLALNAGAHQIQKGDASNLFLITLDLNGEAPTSLQTQSVHHGVWYDAYLKEIHFNQGIEAQQVQIWGVSGRLNSLEVHGNVIQTNYLNPGLYIIRFKSSQGLIQKSVMVY